MRLDQALVARNLCESRQEAQEIIINGHALVNGCIIKKQTKQVSDTDLLTVSKRRRFVSRGGDKLEGALLHIYENETAINRALSGWSALDVGSSTGGFTDCLLAHGVCLVTAVDVGTSQLHSRLHNDTRIVLFENTDIRNFTTTKIFEIITADVSFIPLEKIIDTIVHLASSGTVLLLLIKPQFEVGKGNTKKGIVKEEAYIKLVLEKYKNLAEEKHIKDIKVFPSILKGGEGNQEYFLSGIVDKKTTRRSWWKMITA